MFYKMIENKCKEWYSSDQCTVRNLIEYIEKTGQMRDAQIEAIKVYLFLKIGCECKPLEFLFRYGCFNSINLNDIELSTATREYLEENPAATALFEYARLTNDKGEQVSEKLEKQIKKDPSSIDYDAFFRTAFYGVSYTDYLFSLPMGAGKTYLMAAFICLFPRMRTSRAFSLASERRCRSCPWDLRCITQTSAPLPPNMFRCWKLPHRKAAWIFKRYILPHGNRRKVRLVLLRPLPCIITVSLLRTRFCR